jgi:cytochrome b pre-mRNA-processing protein 3
MGLASLFRRKPHERTGFELYGAAVAAARAPRPYADWGVPDTTAGRFELICLTAGLLIRRLKAEGGEAADSLAQADRLAQADSLAQAVFDAMFSDMDVNLREMGVGDLSVGKRVKFLWESFHGRAMAYAQALDAQDEAALSAALARNVWAGTPPPEGAPQALAAHAGAIAAALAAQPLAGLAAGRVAFPAP